MSTDLIYGLDVQITETGSLGIGNIKDEESVRFVITNAGPTNLIRVRGRIFGQTSWTILADYTANVDEIVSVFTYDEIEVLCVTYDSLSTYVQIIATSFDISTLPARGTTGQVLVKVSNTDYDVTWTSGGGGGAVDSVNGKTGVVVLDKTDIGLSNVDNTSDATYYKDGTHLTDLGHSMAKVYVTTAINSIT